MIALARMDGVDKRRKRMLRRITDVDIVAGCCIIIGEAVASRMQAKPVFMSVSVTPLAGIATTLALIRAGFLFKR